MYAIPPQLRCTPELENMYTIISHIYWQHHLLPVLDTWFFFSFSFEGVCYLLLRKFSWNQKGTGKHTDISDFISTDSPVLSQLSTCFRKGLVW